MQKLGKTLQHYALKRNATLSLITVCNIALRLLQILEKVHKTGKVYNDLKLDNILVGDSQSSDASLSEI